jgi:hypothetical protein
MDYGYEDGKIGGEFWGYLGVKEVKDRSSLHILEYTKKSH